MSSERLTERKEQLLAAIVEDYVASAVPVSSQGLVTKHQFSYSPATIRNEMLAMEREGYLQQPHTSAGRIPTEQGYRYYLAHLVKGRQLPRTVRSALHSLRVTDVQDSRSVKAIARKVADLVDLAVIVGFARGNVYYTGLTNMLHQPEFAEQSQFTHVMEVVDHIDQVLDEYYDQVGDDVTILFGEDNPFSASCGTVITRFSGVGNGEGVFGILGPMRMDYPRVTELVRYTTQQILPAA